MDSIRDRLALGAIWLVGARALANVGGFLGTLILARLLLPEDFGLVAIALTIATIASAVTEVSVLAALIHLAALIGGLAWPIGAIYDDPRLVPIMLALAGVAFLWSLCNPKLMVLMRELVFWQEAVMNFGQKLATLLVSVAVAWAFRSHWAIVAGQAASAATMVVLSYAFMPFRPRLSLYDVRRMFSYSVWLSLVNLVSALNGRVDPLLIGYASGNTALGHYTVGDNLAALPTREVLAPVSGTLFPGFAKVLDDPEALRRSYLRAQTLLAALAFPAGFGLALVAEPLVLVALGERWAPAAPIIQLLAGAFALQTLGSALQPLAMATGATRALFNREVITFALRLPLVVAGLLLGGLMGAVIGRCLGLLIGTALGMALVRRLVALPLRAQLMANWRTILATLAMIVGVEVGLAVLARAAPGAPALAVVVATVLGGAAIYVAALVGAWTAAGRPQGPERDLLQLARRRVPWLSRP